MWVLDQQEKSPLCQENDCGYDGLTNSVCVCVCVRGGDGVVCVFAGAWVCWGGACLSPAMGHKCLGGARCRVLTAA